MVIEPIRTELVPRVAPKLLPLTVTRVLVLPVLRIQGEVMVTLEESLPVAVMTCRLPVRAPVGTRT